MRPLQGRVFFVKKEGACSRQEEKFRKGKSVAARKKEGKGEIQRRQQQKLVIGENPR